MNTLDSTFEMALKYEAVPELLASLINSSKEQGINLCKNSKAGIIGWLIDKDLHKNEEIVKLFLKGFFNGKEKVQIMDALIADKEYKQLEVFWKSRAAAVQRKMIERAPIHELPFLLGTKNKKLLALIEQKLEASTK